MDIVGLTLAFPTVLLANFVYAFLVHRFLRRFARLRSWLLWPSLAVLVLMLLDLVSVAMLGAVASRRSLGPVYWALHLAVVVLGAPALANVLLTVAGRRWYGRWYVVAAACFVLGMALVFFQVAVGDALFGPDGIGGPYGQPGG